MISSIIYCFVFLFNICISKIIKNRPYAFCTRFLWSNIFVCDIYPCWFFCSISFTFISYLYIIILYVLGFTMIPSCSFLCIYIMWLFLEIPEFDYFSLTFGIISPLYFYFVIIPQTLSCTSRTHIQVCWSLSTCLISLLLYFPSFFSFWF